jgi:hypothetical protein
VNTPDPFRFDDGAYVLGILDEVERTAFERHLLECDDCTERVAAARAGADLLSGLTQRDVDETVPVPDTLLPSLLRQAGREHRRRRWITGSLGGLVAASAAAIVVLLWPASSTHTGDAALAFHQVRPGPVSATATLVARSWGTEVDLHCHYASNVEHYVPYTLIVIDKAGHPHQAGSWTLSSGGETEFVGGTSVQRSDIKTMQIAVGPTVLLTT